MVSPQYAGVNMQEKTTSTRWFFLFYLNNMLNPFVLFRSNVPVFPGVMLVQAIQQYHRASR